MTTIPPDDEKKAEHPLANVSPEQFKTLLGSDFVGRGRKQAPQRPRAASPWRRVFWSAVILLATIAYVTFRYATTPATVILVNVSGEDAASVVVLSGDQRVDLGPMPNGDVRKVELATGSPLRIEYTFEKRRVWTRQEPLGTFQALTVSIGSAGRVNVMREAPWSQAVRSSR